MPEPQLRNLKMRFTARCSGWRKAVQGPNWALHLPCCAHGSPQTPNLKALEIGSGSVRYLPICLQMIEAAMKQNAPTLPCAQ